jgi:hypothetical protein
MSFVPSDSPSVDYYAGQSGETEDSLLPTMDSTDEKNQKENNKNGTTKKTNSTSGKPNVSFANVNRPIETTLLNYIISGKEWTSDKGNRRQLRQTDAERSLQNKASYAGDEWKIDKLVNITQEFLAYHLSDVLDLSSIVEVSVDLVTVQSVSLKGANSRIDTFALDGKVLFANWTKVPSKNEVHQAVVQCFTDPDRLDRYLTRIRNETAFSSPFLYIKSVYLGLPVDLVQNLTFGVDKAESETATTSSSKEMTNMLNGDMFKSFEWNTFWISVVAGGGCGAIGVFAIGCFLFSRHRAYVKSAQLGLSPTLSFSPRSGLDEDSSSSGDEVLRVRISPGSNNNFNRSGISNVPNRPRSSPRLSQSPSKRSAPQRIKPIVEPIVDDEEYPPSEATSVYSYIDNSTLNGSLIDDQTISLAPSHMYSRIEGVGDEDTVPSRSNLWSIIDGLDPPAHVDNTDVSIEEKDYIIDEEKGSPSHMVVGTRPEQCFIFADSDDDLSLISEKPLLSQSQQRMMDDSDITKPEPASSPRKYNVASAVPLPWKGGASTSAKPAVETERISISELSYSAKKKKNRGPLSPVEELQRIGEDNSSLDSGTSSSHRSNSDKENSVRHSMMPSDVETTSDDDSSLFLGPDPSRYGMLPDDNKIVALSPEARVQPRAGLQGNSPLRANGTTTLTERERMQLGHLNRSDPIVSDDDDDDGVPLPSYYALHDETSTSSNSQQHNLIKSVASF